jgi:serine/threonine protein kinase/WD40 repeat protein
MPTDAADFRREYLLQLPLPLAHLYSRAYNAKDARSRHDNAFYLCEALIKLSAASPIACYLEEIASGQHHVPNIDRLLVQLALPSLGQWVGLLREIARYFGERVDAATHPLGGLWKRLNQKYSDRPAMLALYRRIKNGADGAPVGDTTCSALQIFEALNQYRNGVFGHGGARFDSFFENDMGPLLFPAINELIDSAIWDPMSVPGARLAVITETRGLENERFQIGLRELVGNQGVRIAPLDVSHQEVSRYATGRVVVLWPGRALPLRLDPLFRFRENEFTEEVLFLNADRNGKQVEYLSYTTGKTERDKTMVASLAELLSRVANREITEEDLERLAEQSRGQHSPTEVVLEVLPPAGQRAGDFELLAELGRGGMGVVLLARQLSLGRLVALKMLPSGLTGDAVALARFRREIRLLASCDHPNIIKVLASGELPDGRQYYAMEYVPGCDLAQLWRELSGHKPNSHVTELGDSSWAQVVLSASRKRREHTEKSRGGTAPVAESDSPLPALLPLPLPPLPEILTLSEDPGGYVRRVVTLIRDVALALQTVHDRGIIHRDVSPDNLMLTPDGSRVVLMDFGLAKGQTRTAQSISEPGGFIGKLRYAAPEQLAAAKLTVGPQADVRALGATMWELLTRQRLFGDADDERSLANRILHDDVPNLRTIDRSFDRDLEAIVAHACFGDANLRISSAGRLAEYLQLWLDGKPLPIRTPGLGELFIRWVRENRREASVIAVCIALLAIGGFAAVWQIRSERDSAVASEDKAKKNKTEADAKKRIAETALAEQERLAVTAAKALLDRGEGVLQEGKEGGFADGLDAIEKAAKLLPASSPLKASYQRILDDRRYRGGQTLAIHSHKGGLETAVFSPDGSFYTTCVGNTITLIDTVTGTPWGPGLLHDAPVHQVAVSPDSTRLLVAAGAQVKIWDVSSCKALGQPVPLKSISALLAWSPDGQWLAAANQEGQVFVASGHDGELHGSTPERRVEARQIEFNKQGDRLLIVWQDQTELWDCQKFERIGDGFVSESADAPEQRFLLPVPSVFAPPAAVDGAPTPPTDPAPAPPTEEAPAPAALLEIAPPASDEAETPASYVVFEGEPPATIPAIAVEVGVPLDIVYQHRGAVLWAEFIPDGKNFVTAGSDGVLCIRSSTNGHVRAVPIAEPGTISCARFHPSLDRLLVCKNQQLFVLDTTLALSNRWNEFSSEPVESVRCTRLSVLPEQPYLLAENESQNLVVDLRTRRVILFGQAAREGLDISPDGRLRAEWKGGHWIEFAALGDASTWNNRSLSQRIEHPGPVLGGRFSPDGLYFLSFTESDCYLSTILVADSEVLPYQTDSGVGWISQNGDRGVFPDQNGQNLWDLAAGKRIGAPFASRETLGVVFAEGGNSFVYPNGKGWEVRSGSDGSRIGSSVDSAVGDINFARLSNSKMGAILGVGATVSYVDWETEDFVRIQLDGEAVTAEVDESETRLFAITKEGRVSVWDLKTKRPVFQAVPSDSPIQCSDYSLNGAKAAIGCADGVVRLLDGNSGRVIRAFQLDKSIPSVVALDDKATLLAVGDKRGIVTVFRTADGLQLVKPRQLPPNGSMRRLRGRFPKTDAIEAFAFDSKSQILAIGSHSGTLHLLDTKSDELATLSESHEATITSVSIENSDSMLVSASQDGVVRVWDIAANKLYSIPMQAGKPVRDVGFLQIGLGISNDVVAIQDDGEIVACLASDPPPSHGFLPNGEVIQNASPPAYSTLRVSLDAKPVSLSARGDRVAVVSRQNVRILGVNDGTTIDEPLRLESPAFGVALSHSGRAAAIATAKGLLLWQAGEGIPTQYAGGAGSNSGQSSPQVGTGMKVPPHGDWASVETVRAVSFSPDDSRIAVAVDAGLQIWRVDDLSTPTAFFPMRSPPSLAVWSRTGKRLAVVGDFTTDKVLLIDPIEGSSIRELSSLFQSEDRMPRSVVSLIFSPDETTLAVVWQDHMGMWDTDLGMPIGKVIESKRWPPKIKEDVQQIPNFHQASWTDAGSIMALTTNGLYRCWFHHSVGSQKGSLVERPSVNKRTSRLRRQHVSILGEVGDSRFEAKGFHLSLLRKLEPSLVDYSEREAAAWVECGSWIPARNAVNRALALGTENADTLALASEFAWLDGNKAQSEAYIEKALSIAERSDVPALRASVAMTASILGGLEIDRQRVLKLAESAVVAGESSDESEFARGAALLRSGEVDKAVAEFQKVEPAKHYWGISTSFAATPIIGEWQALAAHAKEPRVDAYDRWILESNGQLKVEASGKVRIGTLLLRNERRQNYGLPPLRLEGQYFQNVPDSDSAPAPIPFDGVPAPAAEIGPAPVVDPSA